ncbi:hypothetical protein VP01_3314g3 [Puccinia sorghi]|uniref:Reverse transcriptase Ty1/copia-type domain-containing protein n=1 Tax=Puccinia sorghi TaxID=27349 RepID=A0A0L6UZ72_9BASI|nr:hypothetical protein VP01_3314g3 [Puccinia sorghi]
MFLFDPLQEEIYIKTPEGLKRTAPYLKLVKSLYGLQQALKNWYQRLNSWRKNSFIFFHVDNLIIVGKTDKFERLFLARFPNYSAHFPDTLLGMNLAAVAT